MSLRTNVTAQRKRNISSGDRRRDLEFLKCYHRTNLAGENVKTAADTKPPKPLHIYPQDSAHSWDPRLPTSQFKTTRVLRVKFFALSAAGISIPPLLNLSCLHRDLIPFLLSLVAPADDSSVLPPCSLSQPALTWDGLFHHGL